MISQPDDPSEDYTPDVAQNALVLSVHGDGGTQGTEWVFTGWFGRECFRKMRVELLEGQLQPQKSKVKNARRNRRR